MSRNETKRAVSADLRLKAVQRPPKGITIGRVVVPVEGGGILFYSIACSARGSNGTGDMNRAESARARWICLMGMDVSR